MYNRKDRAMTKKRFMGNVGMVLAVAMGVAGCETPAQTAGSGAALGGLLGGVIGHQSGRAWEGAAIGAVLGGVAGLVAHDVRARKVREAQPTAEYYNYQPAQGLRIYGEPATVAPTQITKGNTVKATMEYAVLGAPPSGITVVEKRVLKKDGAVLAELESDTVTRTDGTWVSTMDIAVGADVAPGTYELAQTLETPQGQQIQSQSYFTVL
jgi:hypothetical protein